MSVTRSEPPAPAPVRTVTLGGDVVSVGHAAGLLSLPPLNAKSAAPRLAASGSPAISTMIPLMPLE